MYLLFEDNNTGLGGLSSFSLENDILYALSNSTLYRVDLRTSLGTYKNVGNFVQNVPRRFYNNEKIVLHDNDSLIRGNNDIFMYQATP